MIVLVLLTTNRGCDLKNLTPRKGGVAWRSLRVRFHNYFLPLLNKVLRLRHFNKFESLKSLGAYNWYVKMPWCGFVEHGLEYFSFYVKKHIAHLSASSGSPAGLWWAARGARISETRLFHGQIISINSITQLPTTLTYVYIMAGIPDITAKLHGAHT